MVVLFVRESEHGYFRGSKERARREHEGAGGAPKEHGGSMGEYVGRRLVWSLVLGGTQDMGA